MAMTAQQKHALHELTTRGVLSAEQELAVQSALRAATAALVIAAVMVAGGVSSPPSAL